MTFGENPKKVQNIVDGHFDELAGLYIDILRSVSGAFHSLSSAVSCSASESSGCEHTHGRERRISRDTD